MVIVYFCLQRRSQTCGIFKEFFDLMMEGQEYPFGDEPLYLDVKLYGHMPKAEFEKAKAEYQAEMEQRKAEEVDAILNYVKEHNLGKVFI